MKQIRSILGLPLVGFVVVFALVAFAVSYPPHKAQAQSPSYGTNIVSVPFKSVAASTASNMLVVVDCSKQSSVALALSAASATSTTITQSFYFAHSIDGTTNAGSMESVGILVPVVSTGTTPVTVVTNIPSNSAGFLIGLYVTNAAASGTSTNLSIRYPNKISAP